MVVEDAAKAEAVATRAGNSRHDLVQILLLDATIYGVFAWLAEDLWRDCYLLLMPML